jgi:hypothetical protein
MMYRHARKKLYPRDEKNQLRPMKEAAFHPLCMAIGMRCKQ